jgi:hypothetical protein
MRYGKLIDWLAELTAECPKKIARNMNDPCGACPARRRQVRSHGSLIAFQLRDK